MSIRNLLVVGTLAVAATAGIVTMIRNRRTVQVVTEVEETVVEESTESTTEEEPMPAYITCVEDIPVHVRARMTSEELTFVTEMLAFSQEIMAAQERMQ